ncbi:hypothetical protein CBR_g26112 [Chara braunii]|uniref:Uncharacterized protein n=1 Tax=Chara braunii TaxID=69332 RepID=A0A388JVV7_CHABU|nr:hypothetical protein CBR_g26112 [Chara braunii]|eukprot:GBG61949.1 hypothetical protein CBR_g26112 [Chara braunii]
MNGCASDSRRQVVICMIPVVTDHLEGIMTALLLWTTSLWLHDDDNDGSGEREEEENDSGVEEGVEEGGGGGRGIRRRFRG